MNDHAWLVLGFLVGALAIPLGALLFRLAHVVVNEGEVVLVSRFGRLASTLSEPGLHRFIDRALPWVGMHRVSLRREHRTIENIVVNDLRGTTVIVDVFLELRVADPVKALFGVVDWRSALTNVVSHAVISLLGSRDLKDILSDRTELRTQLEREIADETERWGVRIERVFLRDVRLGPELGQQLLQSVAARLERWRADIEEEGRQLAARREAETSAEVASLVAEARTQYPLAVGRAFAQLSRTPRIRAAYDALYELSLLQPHRTVSFVGFGEGEVRAVDAAMLAPDDDGPAQR